MYCSTFLPFYKFVPDFASKLFENRAHIERTLVSCTFHLGTQRGLLCSKGNKTPQDNIQSNGPLSFPNYPRIFQAGNVSSSHLHKNTLYHIYEHQYESYL